MRRILTFLLIVLAFQITGRNVFAREQNENVCYSQCIAYKFVWHGTYCYDLFTDNCTEDSGNAVIKTIKLLKDVYDTLKSGDNIDTVFKAWFVCKPLIENCIVPHQQDCHTTCSLDKFTYAPDLSVGHPDGSFHGVYYDQKTGQLYFKLVNNGMGYAWDIDVEATSGHTPNRDGKISGGTQLFKERVEHLIYLGARNGPPKSFSDTVSDFLIEESLNGQYLHDFKSWLIDSLELHSDSKNYNVPNYWIKAVPFVPKPGELNRVIFNVDGNKLIPESNENNNTYIFELDLRPTPARFYVETLSQHIVEGSLSSFLVNFQVKNTGEENGVAQVKIYNGKYEQGKTPIFETEQNISGKSTGNLEATVSIDAKNENDAYCGKLKEFTLVVFDADGNKTERKFSLPIYVGSINGRVEDLFGKKIVGATIKASTGEEIQSNKYGNYSLRGITSLGRITVTASHNEFSKSESKELEFKYVNEFEACNEGNLNLYSVNFVLKDQDVFFTISVKDRLGNLVNAHVLAVNSDFRKEADISGSGPMPELQPGKYTFTITAPGYKTLSQDVNAVPNESELVFVLEKLAGRPDDTGLNIISPRLLWENTLGTGGKEIGNMVGTKNGKLLVISVADNQDKTRKLHFIDLLTGSTIREVSVPWSVEEQRFVGLDASYDGGTVGLFINTGVGKNKEEILKLFDAGGNEIGSMVFDKNISVSMDVSPDGFYVCPYLLLNKGLHRYTRYETEGKGDDNFERNPATCGDYFLRNNNLVTNCNEGLCEETISNQQIRVIGDIKNITTETKYDSSYDDSVVVARTYKTLYYYGVSVWNKELKSDPSFKSVSISPGGDYVLTTAGDGSDAWLKLKIYDSDGEDKTPDFSYKDVNFVFANDKGLFFASTRSNKISFYQVGEYDTDYQPEVIPQTTNEEWTNGLSYMGWANQFYPAGDTRFADLDPGVIYRADRDIILSIIRPFTSISLGSLTITKDTLFSVNYDHNPVLIKGQLTADFEAPFTIYAIKFDRNFSGLFLQKLNDFLHHTLPEDEYFIVKNIHTKFTVKNETDNLSVLVDSGDVQIISKNIDETVTTNRQITIDGKGNIKNSIYINPKIYVFVILIILLVTGILIFVFKKTKIRIKIIEDLRHKNTRP